MVALLQVECLEEVIRTKSFRRAAASLRMSQPAVSGQIARLERELNLTLLERGASGSVLTAAGERILPHLRGFVERTALIGRASQEIARGATTSLTIAGEPHLIYDLLPRALAVVRDRFVNVTLVVQRRGADELYEGLRAGTEEIGLLALTADAVVPDDIISVPLFDLGPIGVTAPAGHPIVGFGTGPLEPAALAGQPLVIVGEGRSASYADRCFPRSMRTSVTIVEDMDAGFRLVDSGVGIMLSSGVTSHLAAPELPWRALVGAPTCSARLLHDRTHRVSAAAMAFMDLLMLCSGHYQSTFLHDADSGRLVIASDASAPATFESGLLE